MEVIWNDNLLTYALAVFQINFYQPAHKACDWLVLGLLYIFCLCVCLSVCVSCAIFTSRKLLPCDFISSVLAALSTGVATMSSLAQWDAEKQRQCKHNNVRLTEIGNARSQQLLVMPTESLTNWEGLPGELFSGLDCLKARLVFRYEIACFFFSGGAQHSKWVCRHVAWLGV